MSGNAPSRRSADRGRADRRALRAALSRFLAHHGQPHPGLGPVRPRLRHPVRLHRAVVVRPVGLFRHRRHGRRLSAHGRGLSERHGGAVHRHDRGGGHRLSGRPDRAPAHRHLFRHDHGGDRGGVLFRRVQSAVGIYRRRERAARRADARAFDLGFTTIQFDTRLVDVCLPGVLVFRRHRDRAAHRALAGRRDPAARSATTRCARPPSATTSTATSSSPSSSPRPMPALPAGCSA